MTEPMLLSLMRLFALIANINQEVASIMSRSFVESYLRTQFSAKLVEKALQKFDEYLHELQSLQRNRPGKKTSAISVKILSICDKINQELHIRNKFMILFSLIQFSRYFEETMNPGEEFRQNISDTVKTISDGLLIQGKEFQNCRAFIADKFYKVPEKEKILVVSDNKSFTFKEINHLQKDSLNEQIFFLRIHQADTYIFYYSGNTNLELGGKIIFPRHIYILPKGSSLTNEGSPILYYSEIVSAYLRRSDFEPVSFLAHDIDFQYRNSQYGIKKFSFSAVSGELIGVMGASGAGKSTLIKVLNGSIAPRNGNIYINGHDLLSDKEILKGTIAYVPQDDLLIEELTVYQNLWFNAKLCLGKIDTEEIREIVERTLNNLDLLDIKDMKVGSPLNKFISGGQRKRLNIALELVMEPQILFADEPTSGLSSKDSENVMQILKELSMTGKIVIVNIHQPSSGLFRMFDKLLILDKGGFPIYTGNPLDAFSYLKNIVQRVDAAEIECQCCGNVQTDDLLNIIEAKQVNEFGEYTNERLVPPEKWYELFLKNFNAQQKKVPVNIKLPSLTFNPPDKIVQFLTFSKRNFLSKIADRQYVLFALLVPPLLALILGFFTKYVSGTSANPYAYLFSKNENLPAYIFMSVIVSLFIGLIISAEEIIKDRKIIERESFLNLSRASYLNSKIAFLFALSAIQMLAFVIPGNHLLGIKGLNTGYWLVLFSTTCFAVMLGLNISSALKSAVAIYINIPFILVPLILLAGVIVKYDKLHYKVASIEYTPLTGDIMASRWAYEALMVHQFRNNRYQRHFYEVDREMANAGYEINFLIPNILNKLNDIERFEREIENHEKSVPNATLINRTLASHSFTYGISFPHLIVEGNTITGIETLREFLNNRRHTLSGKINSLVYQKDQLIESLIPEGEDMTYIIVMKENFHNESVADMVLNNNEMRKITEQGGLLLRKDSPVYQYPASYSGRAHFYAGNKRIGSMNIKTIWFNTGVIWLMTIFLHITLTFDILRRLIRFVQDMKLFSS